MSEVKLYKGNECGEILACVERKNEKGMFTWLDHKARTGYITKIMLEKYYTPLPEAPGVDSEWAFTMIKHWYKAMLLLFSDIDHDWELYEELKPIIEKFPHEFEPYDIILLRNTLTEKWVKGSFAGISQHIPQSYDVNVYMAQGTVKYCLPFSGNEHLEGQITDGEHGAVPKGYVPPHVPKLGDDAYWMKGDEVLSLSNLCNYVVHSINKNRFELRVEEVKTGHTKFYHVNGKFLGYGGKGLRLLYHKGSYVKPDGTVHEHIPTRPHKILDPDAKP